MTEVERAKERLREAARDASPSEAIRAHPIEAACAALAVGALAGASPSALRFAASAASLTARLAMTAASQALDLEHIYQLEAQKVLDQT